MRHSTQRIDLCRGLQIDRISTELWYGQISQDDIAPIAFVESACTMSAMFTGNGYSRPETLYKYGSCTEQGLDSSYSGVIKVEA
jgi:hypothetical protein